MAAVSCAACNTQIARESKFCPECGTPVSGDEAKRSKKTTQLGEEAHTIISSINATISHATKCLEGKVDNVSKDVKALESHLAATTKRVDDHDLRLEAVESELKTLRELIEAGGPRSSASGQTPNAQSSESRTAAVLHKRQSVVVGGFERDTAKEIIEKRLKIITSEVKDTVKETFSLGKVSSVGIIVFSSSKCMWDFLKKYKGQRFSHNDRDLWHSIEKTKEERELCKRVSRGVKIARSQVAQTLGVSDDEAKKKVDGDWVRGMVYLKQEETVVRIFEKERDQNVLKLASTAKHVFPDLDPAELVNINNVE